MRIKKISIFIILIFSILIFYVIYFKYLKIENKNQVETEITEENSIPQCIQVNYISKGPRQVLTLKHK